MSKSSDSWAEINGRQYRRFRDGIYRRVLQPGERRPPEAHATTPHPSKTASRRGYRIAWVFILTIALAVFLTAVAL